MFSQQWRTFCRVAAGVLFLSAPLWLGPLAGGVAEGAGNGTFWSSSPGDRSLVDRFSGGDQPSGGSTSSSSGSAISRTVGSTQGTGVIRVRRGGTLVSRYVGGHGGQQDGSRTGDPGSGAGGGDNGDGTGGRLPGSNPPASGLAPDEQQMFNLVNDARRANGVRPVELDMRLTQLARMKGRDMLGKGYGGHYSPTYGSPADMVRNAGIDFWWVGENLGSGSSVQRVFDAFMNSPAHRNNILYPYHTRVGIGITEYEKWGRRWLLVVQEFLTPGPPR